MAELHFQGFDIDPVARVLRVGGEPVDVGSRAFDVLLTLARQPDEVVSKRQILDSAWGTLTVEENNISVQISALRKLLGAQAIATVPAIGYRLSVPRRDDTRAPAPPARPEPAPGGPTASAATTPAASSAQRLVGREADLATLEAWVAQSPLVSITGTGGVGKTALAKALVAQRSTALAGDVCWLELDLLRNGDELVPRLAAALQIEILACADGREALLQALSQAQVLVVMDNCEHLSAAVAEMVSAALARAPGVRWLLTSRTPLHVAGERVYRLDPLAMPGPGVSLDHVAEYPALQLLWQRTVEGDRRFLLDASNVKVAAELCQQLDGLPLAIEMAAARVASLGLVVVHAQLRQRLLLSRRQGPGAARHQSLRQTYDWSYELLTPTERLVFRRLQPFVGGFRVEVACQVVCLDTADATLGEWDILDALGALVDKSLVHRHREQGDRFYLLESARDYAAEVLERHGETASVRRSHAQALARWFDDANDQLDHLADAPWKDRYATERANLRQALAWACEHGEPDTLAVLVAGLAQVDTLLQTAPEVLHLPVPMDRLALAGQRRRAWACLELGRAHHEDGRRQVGTELTRRALEDYREAGDRTGEYRALAQLIRLFESQPGRLGEALEAWARLRESERWDLSARVRLWGEITSGLFYQSDRKAAHLQALQQRAADAGFAMLASTCRVRLSDRLLVDGNYEAVLEATDRDLEAWNLGPRLRSLMLCNRALAGVRLGRLELARQAARAAVRASPGVAFLVLESMALAATHEARWEDAALLAACAARLRHDRALQPDPAEAALIEDVKGALAQRLDAATLSELCRQGEAMPLQAGLARALSPAPETAAATRGWPARAAAAAVPADPAS